LTGRLSVRYTILVKRETVLIILVAAGCFFVRLRAQTGLAAAQGIRAPIPTGWQWNQVPVALGGPLALNNFGGAYDRGGILPPGGAEIDLTRVDLPATPLREFIDRELAGATVESMGEIGVGGSPGMRVIWTDSFAPDLRYENVAVYVVRGQNLFKCYLSYHADDPAAPQFLGAFQQVVTLAQFPN
jgi:hypothetical protein